MNKDNGESSLNERGWLIAGSVVACSIIIGIVLLIVGRHPNQAKLPDVSVAAPAIVTTQPVPTVTPVVTRMAPIRPTPDSEAVAPQPSTANMPQLPTEPAPQVAATPAPPETLQEAPPATEPAPLAITVFQFVMDASNLISVDNHTDRADMIAKFGDPLFDDGDTASVWKCSDGLAEINFVREPVVTGDVNRDGSSEIDWDEVALSAAPRKD